MLGVRLSLDDFGTSYSSLGYVKSFAVDTVKIDRSFVSGLGQSTEDDAIVAAVIGLAHTLLEAVAEGVETANQLALLRHLGCDLAQGYHFTRPGPPDGLGGLLDRPLSTSRPPGAGELAQENLGWSAASWSPNSWIYPSRRHFGRLDYRTAKARG